MQKSYLNVIDIETGEVSVLHTYEKIIEAPNWNQENGCLYFNSEGHIYRYDPSTDRTELIETGICDACNNDHVLSPDATKIAVSHNTNGDWLQCQIYVCPIEGGTAVLATPAKPSFLHGWSSTTNELCYCAFRTIEGIQHVDVYTTKAPEETDRTLEEFIENRLTSEGFNDGPEFSPDGKHIWYNSTVTGLMQIWRMNADGTGKVQMTDNDKDNWFAHVSPDGTKVVYLAFNKEDQLPEQHLPNLHVELWLMDYDGSNKRKLVSLFGGQGTINVNSWNKDSKRLAFVSYDEL
jgi:Tol biopolymer transport system component